MTYIPVIPIGGVKRDWLLITIVSRKEARAAGAKRYFTGDPCASGHICERYTKTTRCVQCNRDNAHAWERENPEKRKAWTAANRDRINASIARTKAKRPEHYQQLMLTWREENAEQYKQAIADAKAKKPEKYREIGRLAMRRRRAKDPEKSRAYDREWDARNRDKRREYHNRWRENNPEAYMANQRRTNARRRGAAGAYSKEDISDILKQQNGKCAYFRICGVKFSMRKKFYIDHITPITRGGTNDRKNLQLTCQRCNSRKFTKEQMAFARELGLLL